MTKILLVEDDKSLREIYSVRLLAEGYTLISCGDGEEALAAAIGEKPDLIISDVMMPKISGFEMLDLLRSNEATKNIKVIMLTALSSEQQRERGDRLGADRYLIKSQVGIEDIVRTVHDVLGDGGQQKTLSQMENNSNASGNNSQATAPTQQAQQTTASMSTNPVQPTAQQVNRAPMAESPFNSILNNNQSVMQSVPAGGQSAFNPLAATAPAATAGVPAPKLPDTPMDIPARTTAQAPSPATYATAMQAADNLLNSTNLNNAPAMAQAINRHTQNVPTQPVLSANSPTSNQTAPITSNQATIQPIVQRTSIETPPANEPQLQAVPLPGANGASVVPTATTPTPVAQPSMQAYSQSVTAQPQPNAAAAIPSIQPISQQPIQSAPTTGYNAAPGYGTTANGVRNTTATGGSYIMGQSVPQPSLNQQYQQLETKQDQEEDRTAGGERVIKPLPGYAGASASPKINIDELLAESNYGSQPSSTFPQR